MQEKIHFPGGTTLYDYDSSIGQLPVLAGGRRAIYITDNKVHKLHPKLFNGTDTIVIPEGENHKSMDSVQQIIDALIRDGADRQTLLIGIGGGMITDITGFVAAIYMRGIAFGFVPTTLLAMTDAAIGGKNGVNTGLYKNMIGTIRQPEFILYDLTLLQTLERKEWSNGFAEVIKYACLFDAPLFATLAQHTLEDYGNDRSLLSQTIRVCAGWKNKTVAEDEQEKGIRKLLNFGHTVGHAVEKRYALPHGYAVAIGMMVACKISEQITGLDAGVRTQLGSLLHQYGLPVSMEIAADDIMALVKMDKKKKDGQIQFILLEQIGKATIREIAYPIISENLGTI